MFYRFDFPGDNPFPDVGVRARQTLKRRETGMVKELALCPLRIFY